MLLGLTYVVTLSELIGIYVVAGLLVTALVFLAIWGIGELVNSVRTKVRDIWRRLTK